MQPAVATAAAAVAAGGSCCFWCGSGTSGGSGIGGCCCISAAAASEAAAATKAAAATAAAACNLAAAAAFDGCKGDDRFQHSEAECDASLSHPTTTTTTHQLTLTRNTPKNITENTVVSYTCLYCHNFMTGESSQKKVFLGVSKFYSPILVYFLVLPLLS